MSMYNTIYGVNPLAGTLLNVLGHSLGNLGKLGRFRDCYLQRNDSGELEIHVFTRNGGGNRQHAPSLGERGPGCACPGCFMAYRAAQLPWYVRDFDDDLDATYATLVFKVPHEDVREVLEEVVRVEPDIIPKSFRERHNEFLATLEKDPNDPAVIRLTESLAPIIQGIERKL